MAWTEWTDSNFRGLNLRDLKVDEAFLNISNAKNKRFFFYSLSEECVKCPFKKIKVIEPNKDTLIKLDVSRSLQLRILDKDVGNYAFSNQSSIWSAQPDLGQFGVYDLRILDSSAIKFETAKDAVNIYTSLIFISAIIVVFYWLCKMINKFYSSPTAPNSHSGETNQQSCDGELDPPKMKKRLKSLDIFRGIAIVLMIFVNDGAGGYWFFEHATWNGLNLADLVFPFFLFSMGVCIPMSIKSLINQQIPMQGIMQKVVKRSVTLFAIGLCLNTTWGATFENIRIFGVLQRFGIAYLVVSLIHLAFVKTSVANADSRLQRIFFDVRIIWKEWAVVLSIVFVYIIILFGFKTPSCSFGYMGPGGIHDYIQHQNCTGGVAGTFDRTILGPNHMYQKAKIRKVYDALVFDPENCFGILMTIVQVFLGVQCGITLLTFSTYKDRLRRWVSWGLGLATLTGFLTFFSIEDGIIPINKNLWSLSFVTVTTSLAFLLLSIIYYLVDVKNIGDDFWTIFLYPGMNSIILYIGHTIFHSMWPFHWKFNTMNTHFVLMLESIYTVILWIFIAHKLFHKKIFYSI